MFIKPGDIVKEIIPNPNFDYSEHDSYVVKEVRGYSGLVLETDRPYTEVVQSNRFEVVSMTEPRFIYCDRSDCVYFTFGKEYLIVDVSADHVYVYDDRGVRHQLTYTFVRDNFVDNNFAVGLKQPKGTTAKDGLDPTYAGLNTVKDTNPKDAVGCRKPPMSTVSVPVMQEVGVAMLEGAMKYGRHNYRAAGVRTSIYYDAALRHLLAYWEGEDIDPDSGLSHLSKAIAGLAVLRDCEISGNIFDDRPPQIKLKEHRSLLQEVVDGLFEKYPDPVPPHTEKNNVR